MTINIPKPPTWLELEYIKTQANMIMHFNQRKRERERDTAKALGLPDPHPIHAKTAA